MARQAAGAEPARRSARASAGLGERGKPRTRKVSSSYPASGTSCASTRSGDPANVTNTPRAVNASATASADSTCPAVPPAAITHRSCLGVATMSDVKEDSHRGEEDDEARASVREERKRNSGQRGGTHDGCDVERSLPADERSEPRREELPKWVMTRACDLEARPREQPVGEDHHSDPDEPELLADIREHHVRVGLGQVEDLPDALPETDAEDPP